MPIVFNVKNAICLIFAAATLACHFTSGFRVCMPPLLYRACMLARGLAVAVSSYQAKRKRKPNEIRLSINNQLIQFD